MKEVLDEQKKRRYERFLASSFVSVEEGEGSDGGGDIQKKFETPTKSSLVEASSWTRFFKNFKSVRQRKE